MSASPRPPDDHRDRLIDRVLAEALGGERPPDLSPTILDRLEEQRVNVATVHHAKKSFVSWRSTTLLVATAASVIACVLLLPRGVRNERDVALIGGEDRREVTRSEIVSQESLSDQPAPAPASEADSVNSLAKKESTAKSIAKSASPATVPVEGPLVGDLATISDDQSLPFRQGSFTADQPHFGYANSSAGRPASGAARPAVGLAIPSSPPVALHDLTAALPEQRQILRRRLSESESREFYYREPRFTHESPTADRYAPLQENPFTKPLNEDALSTFSIDVDTASYSNVRQYLIDMRQTPPAGAVRVEELVNYFEYDYAPPPAGSEAPFAAAMAVAPCPWAPSHRLVRIGVKGREVAVDKRPLSNLVFLVDVSGSMNEPNKLPLVIEGLKALTDKLGENDRVAIAVYAGSEGLVLPSTTGDQKDAIRSALSRLTAGGSTAGGAGLKLAYEVAERHKIVGGVNRVVLCTDGDFNVGMTGTEELAGFVETRAKETGVYLTVLGFGRGNLNDAMLEQISGRGDGHYAYIDNEREARRVLSQDLSGTLVTIAKDVKLQVEFNPAKVASYRLVGYENRVLAAEDFNNDAKDAGDIGAGHTVTALYEIVPVGVEPPAPRVEGLKYQQAEGRGQRAEQPTAESRQPLALSPELLTLKIRYKRPEGGASTKLEFPLVDTDKTLDEADADFRWAAAVAEFGMLLRGSQHVGDGSYDAVLDLAREALGDDPHGYRAEFLDLVRRAKELSGR